jgi:hypothetical protein
MYTPKLICIFDTLTYAGVMQDKSELLYDRLPSDQPYRHVDEIRSNHTNGNGFRSNNTPMRSQEALVPYTTQIKRFVKEEIQRLAKQEKLSDSAVGSAFLERQVQHNIDMQYGVMLEPIIEKTIERKFDSYANRVAYLAVQAYYAAEESRIINTKVLSYLFGSDTEIYNQIVEQARKDARDNIKKQIEEK